jgi:TATA-box binding protein (TBP) (component of TFIID and TFIIIB)
MDADELATLEGHWNRFRRGVSLTNHQSTRPEHAEGFETDLRQAIVQTVECARRERKHWSARQKTQDTSDEAVSRLARFTDALPLADYAGLLSLVPRLVNVVSLAEALPVQGSGTTLPLDLHKIASRCTNAYLAPRRFAAVQLAFATPRCRVLVFHTGRLVGTGASPTRELRARRGALTRPRLCAGCAGPMAARLAIAKAVRQLVTEVDIHVQIRNFTVINTVGAVSIQARLDCDAFATTHSSTSHYDRASFVGLAWRPANECAPLRHCATPRAARTPPRANHRSICCEIYSTGKANLPGSTRQRSLLSSFSRMYGSLLVHSDADPSLYAHVNPKLLNFHKPMHVRSASALGKAPADADAARGTKRPREGPGAMGGVGLLDADDDLWDLAPLEAGGAGGVPVDLDDADDGLLDAAGF